MTLEWIIQFRVIPSHPANLFRAKFTNGGSKASTKRYRDHPHKDGLSLWVIRITCTIMMGPTDIRFQILLKFKVILILMFEIQP